MVLPDVHQPPMIVTAHRFQVVDVLCLKGFVVFSGVSAGRKFISEILFEFCKFSYYLYPP